MCRATTTSEIEAEEGVLVELRNVIKVSQESRAEATQALASAGALDGKGESASDDESVDLAANIDALTRAIAALEKGVAMSSILQSQIGSTILKIQEHLNEVVKVILQKRISEYILDQIVDVPVPRTFEEEFACTPVTACAGLHPERCVVLDQ